MAKLLVTGASGLLGANLVLDALSEFEVVGVYHQNAVGCDGAAMIQADLAEPGVARGILEDVRPDWVVHCAAATHVDRCEERPEWAYRLNRDMAAQVAEASQASGAYLVHISTDAVFDGASGGYAEGDEPNPINVYAASKLAGEQAVAGIYPEALIVRTNLFGWNATDKPSLAEWFLKGLEGRETLIGFADVEFNPILVNHLGKALLAAFQQRAAGIYHMAGSTCLSKYDFGVRVAEASGHSADSIRPGALEDIRLRARRSKRLCLDVGKAERELGLRFPRVEAGIREMLAMRDDGRLAKLKAMSAAQFEDAGS